VLCIALPLLALHLQPQAASAAAGGAEDGPERRVLELERRLKEAESQVASVTGELEATRKRNEDVATLLAAAQAAQRDLAAANESLRTERDAAVAADRNAAAEAVARVQRLEEERQELVTARDTVQQVRCGSGGTPG
jgi:chromosome segregation ATPase